MITHNRRDTILSTIERLLSLPERPAITVVDNASTDGTVAAIRAAWPAIDVVALRRNVGAAARTVGVGRASTPYVAFSDDDSWWAPGALELAAGILDAHPTLGVLAARVLVGPEEREDPVCAMMAASPLAASPLAASPLAASPLAVGPLAASLPTAGSLGAGTASPGPSVLGFVACGSIVRRDAYLAVGGFHPRFGVGGEEELLAADLSAAGWELRYVERVVAHHHPFPTRDPSRRRQIQARNALWFAWLRRRPRVAISRTLAALSAALHDSAMRSALAEALRGLPWIVRERRAAPAALEASLARLERQ